MTYRMILFQRPFSYSTDPGALGTCQLYGFDLDFKTLTLATRIDSSLNDLCSNSNFDPDSNKVDRVIQDHISGNIFAFSQNVILGIKHLDFASGISYSLDF
jgi:hypothetical protein